jgi:hypothetical protein
VLSLGLRPDIMAHLAAMSSMHLGGQNFRHFAVPENPIDAMRA